MWNQTYISRRIRIQSVFVRRHVRHVPHAHPIRSYYVPGGTGASPYEQHGHGVAQEASHPEVSHPHATAQEWAPQNHLASQTNLQHVNITHPYGTGTMDAAGTGVSSQSDIQLTRLFVSMLRQGRIDDVLSTWEKAFGLASSYHRKPTIYQYNSVLNYYVSQQDHDQVLAWSQKMSQEGVSLNVATYNILIRYYMQKGDRKTAMSIVENMKRKGLQPDQYTNAALDMLATSSAEVIEKIKTLLSTNSVQEATELWEKSFQNSTSSIQLDSFSFLPLLSYYAKLPDLQKALEWWNRMESMGVQEVRNVIYNTMLSAYVRSNDLDGAYAFLKKAQDRGFQPDGYTKFILEKQEEPSMAYNDIKSSLANHKVQEALGKFELYVAATPNPSPYLFVPFLFFYARSGNLANVLSWWEKLEFYGVKPNSACFNGRIKGHVLSGDTIGLRKFMTMAPAYGFKPDRYTSAILDKEDSTQSSTRNVATRIKRKLMNGDEKGALNIFNEEMNDASTEESEGRKDCAYAINTFLSHYARHRDSVEVDKWKSRIMNNPNVQPNLATFRILITYYMQSDQEEAAREVYLSGCNNGLQQHLSAFVPDNFKAN